MAARPQSIFDADDTDLCLIKKQNKQTTCQVFFCVWVSVCVILDFSNCWLNWLMHRCWRSHWSWSPCFGFLQCSIFTTEFHKCFTTSEIKQVVFKQCFNDTLITSYLHTQKHGKQVISRHIFHFKKCQKQS